MAMKAVWAVSPPSALPTARPGASCMAVEIEVIAPGRDVAAPTNSAPATTSPIPVRSASVSAT